MNYRAIISYKKILINKNMGLCNKRERYDFRDNIIVEGGTGPIVFITDYGTKYHMAGCQYLYDIAIARPLLCIEKNYEACEIYI
ncbi:MAG: hypothetical protein ABRQ38_10235 [Candidatus Eremiobacterota bacterium]